MISEQMKAVED
jgi:hypothetical protein